MNHSFPTLFTSGKINRLEIKNRLVMGAIGTRAIDPKSGYPTLRMIEYYADRARGGAGLIIVEPAVVGGVVDPGISCLRMDSDECIAELKKLSDAINKNGAKAAIQLVSPLQISQWLKSDSAQIRDMVSVRDPSKAMGPPRYGYYAFAELTK